MRVHTQIPHKKILENTALTVGTFDGVHRGHQMLIARLHEMATARGLQSVALTFDDMPICFFRPDLCPKLLSLREEKIAYFKNTPLDHLFIMPFTQEIAQTPARDFMEIWAAHIGLKLFVGGPDFALGRERSGTIPQLALWGRELGFQAHALDEKLLENGAPISSTRSRGVIEGGQVELARQFLGRAFLLGAQVVEGDKIGRSIGVPTINLSVSERKCLPKNGVYAVWAIWSGEKFPAALNIGFRPTVAGKQLQIEFHVLDRVIETPPPSVEIEFVARLRDEEKFNGLPALVRQMEHDFERARAIFGIKPPKESARKLPA